MSSRTPRLRARVPSIDAELAAWITAEADRRVCHPRLILEAGIRLLREANDTAPDLVDLPQPPRSSSRTTLTPSEIVGLVPPTTSTS